MGKTLQKKLIIISLLLMVTSALAYKNRDIKHRTVGQKSLKEVFSSIDGYSFRGQLKVEQDVIEFLNLDDYMYAAFAKDGINITLYIGYYYSSDKVASAHSPLVCFPAQGWLLGKPAIESLQIGAFTVHYAVVEATLGESKQLIIYWFQTYKHTAPFAHIQKIYGLYDRLVHNMGQNAFIRISIPMDNVSRKNATAAGTDFIRSFYPGFAKYIEDVN